MRPLSQDSEIELVVTDVGNVMLLHRGDLKHEYSWVQYDPDLHALQFITSDGETQDLGMPVHPPFRKPLSRALEMMIFEVTAQNEFRAPILIKCVQVQS